MSARGVESCPFFLPRRGIPAVAVEPNAAAIGLRRNAQLNGLAGDALLQIKSGFVGTSPGAIRLDTLASANAELGFIKIDVDGAELDVLRSAQCLLTEKRASYLVETHSRELEVGCRDLFVSQGYSVKIMDNAWWRRFLPEQRPLPHNRWLTAEARSTS